MKKWEDFQQIKHTCAKGDTRGLMPPSRSICATVQAILSSLVTSMSNKKKTVTYFMRSHMV